MVGERNRLPEMGKIGRSKVFPQGNVLWYMRILDPGSEIVLQWNWVFIISCLVVLFIDPFYFYLPAVGGDITSSCVKTDTSLRIVVTCFRTIADSFYLLHIIIKFRTGYVAPNPTTRVFGTGELVMDPKKIAQRYLRSDFFIDLIATLPLPQVVGAAWYLLSVDRYTSCWKKLCKKEFAPVRCSLYYLDCDTFGHNDRKMWANGTDVFKNCDPRNDIDFHYGIFESAVKKNVVSTGFLEKYFYCLLWGLQQLSSYGQNLSTSRFIGETLFAILIAILGLVLFAHLIGNIEYKWLATRGVNEEAILHGLPADLHRDIQRHLCLDLVRCVPFFSQMDDQLLDAISECLLSSLSTEGTYLVHEVDPVIEMLFIIRGRLESSTTNGGQTGFFNSIVLRPGDFCGVELLAWALLPKSTMNLPSSTRTVRALVEVEAFALCSEDLKSVANQFR
ncbi:hypothetical protein CRYUN_Cryun02cG0104200 [Craigia yunnanensis]